jgi:hypothetical protein
MMLWFRLIICNAHGVLESQNGFVQDDASYCLMTFLDVSERFRQTHTTRMLDAFSFQLDLDVRGF